jgi:hypothetical protein
VKRIAAIVALSVAWLALLSGCSRFRSPEAPDCDPHSGYQDIEAGKPLRVPSGLELPEQSSSTPMPSGPRSAVVSRPDGRCLESPPSFFAVPGETDEPGLPVAQTIGVESSASGGGPAPVLISGASVLTNDVAAFLDNWAKVWTARNVEEYFQFYSTDFAPAGYDGHAQWQDTQRQRFQVQAQTEIVLDSLKVETEADGTVRAEFVQRFGAAPNYRSVLKQMALTKGGTRGWLIESERILDVL